MEFHRRQTEPGEDVGKFREAPRALMRSRKGRILLGVLVAALGLVAAVAVHVVRQRSTLEYAVRGVNEAIRQKDRVALAGYVDFVNLSEKLARAVLARTPDAGEDDLPRYQDAVQRHLLEIFSPEAAVAGKNAIGANAPSAAGRPLEDPVFNILREPLAVLPGDLLEQLQERPFAIQRQDRDVGILASSVDHPDLEQSFEIHLTAVRADGTWRITQVSNARQLADAFLDKVDELKGKAVHAFEEENARILSLVGAYYHVDDCRPVLFVPSPEQKDGIVQLRVTISGSNMGKQEIVASAVIADFADRNGRFLTSMRLENQRAVKPGESFVHAWFYDFEEEFAEVETLRQADGVFCTARPVNVSMGRATMLYPRDIDDFPGVRFK
jgi:hypothetical protein